MKNRKSSISKWIKAIVMILIASLIYAVYFTELGRPELSRSDPQLTMYNQMAAPTLFVKWQTVPTVELDWAYADQNLLKLAIIIRGLETNINPEEWICKPYIRIEEPVRHRLSQYRIGTVYDAAGESFRGTYEYEINAGGYDSLAIDMDITIGPCADYLNFQESNVTPSVIPELVGNYHSSFQVPVKINLPYLSSTPTSTTMTMWRGLPIFPGGIESNDATADAPVYHYIMENAGMDAVQRFYEDEMPNAGWELFGGGDMSGKDIGKAYSLYFAKDQAMVTVDISITENTIHVFLRLE